MNTDVKPPQPNQPGSDPVETAKVAINLDISEKEDQKKTETAEQTPAPSNLAVPNTNEAPIPPQVDKIDAAQPVPANNVLNLNESGTEAAKKAAEASAKLEEQRQKELEKIAQQALNPEKPTTENIVGQPITGIEQPTDTDTQVSSQITPNQAQPVANAGTPAQPSPKKSRWKFWQKK